MAAKRRMNRTLGRDPAAVYGEKIIYEMYYALGISPTGAWRRVLRPFFSYPAGRFGRLMARADEEVGFSGLSGGCRAILADLSLNVSAHGGADIPLNGPLLVVSNHPGAYDSVAIISCIHRKDLKVIISDVAFTRALSNARRYFIYVSSDGGGGTAALRDSIDHLQSGGSLLVFAHGDVEPDPELSPGSSESIEDWSRSIEIMLRRVPETQLQVTIASGVLRPRFADSPIVKIRKTPARRQKLAEVLQVSQQMVFPRSVRTNVHISFAKPVRGIDLPGDELMPAVIKIARRLLKDHVASMKAAS